MLRLHRRHLHDGTTEIPLDKAYSAFAVEGLTYRPDDIPVQRGRLALAPGQLAGVEIRLPEERVQAFAENRSDVAVEQSVLEQLAHDETQAARSVKVIHVRGAIRVDTCQERHSVRQLGEIGPVDPDTRSLRDRHQVQGMVRRSARREQSDDAVDDSLLVDHMANWRVVFTEVSQFEYALYGRARQVLAQ